MESNRERKKSWWMHEHCSILKPVLQINSWVEFPGVHETQDFWTNDAILGVYTFNCFTKLKPKSFVVVLLWTLQCHHAYWTHILQLHVPPEFIIETHSSILRSCMYPEMSKFSLMSKFLSLIRWITIIHQTWYTGWHYLQ